MAEYPEEFMQFVEDLKIKSKEELLRIYQSWLEEKRIHEELLEILKRQQIDELRGDNEN